MITDARLPFPTFTTLASILTNSFSLLYCGALMLCDESMTKITSKSLSQAGSTIVAVVVLLGVVGGDRVVGCLVRVTKLSEVSVRVAE